MSGSITGRRTPAPLLAAALSAAARGWPVLKLRPGSKVPALENWETAASTDPDQLREWWTEAPYNIGIACGPAGLVVIDLDAAKGTTSRRYDLAPSGTVRHGRETLALLAEQAGQPDPTETYCVHSPSGGEHRYYLAPPGAKLRNTVGAGGATGLGPLVDVRAHGGMIAAAGSVVRTSSGLRRYRPMLNRSDNPAPLPNWLLEALTPPPLPTPPNRAPITIGRGLDSYVRTAVMDECAKVERVESGERATTLFKAAAALGQLVGDGPEILPEHVAHDALLQAARHHNGTDGWTEKEAERHIKNGIALGRSTPRQLTPRLRTQPSGRDPSPSGEASRD